MHPLASTLAFTNQHRKRLRRGRETHVEEVVTGHARLARHASGDDDNLGALKSLLKAVVVRREADGLQVQQASEVVSYQIKIMPSLSVPSDC